MAKAWPEQVKLSEGAKPLNAEFEQWTRQLEGNGDGAVEVNGTVNGVAKENGSAKVNGFTNGFEDEGAPQRIRFKNKGI